MNTQKESEGRKSSEYKTKMKGEKSVIGGLVRLRFNLMKTKKDEKSDGPDQQIIMTGSC